VVEPSPASFPPELTSRASAYPRFERGLCPRDDSWGEASEGAVEAPSDC